MDMRPARRRETFTSLQLQRASDQLQEAIQSARQHRSVYETSNATSLSLLSDSCPSSSDEDEAIADEHDRENQPLEANKEPPQHASVDIEKPTPEQKLRRFMTESMGSTGRRMGASLSLKDLLASPLRPTRGQTEQSEANWTQQLAGESESLRDKKKALSDSSRVMPPIVKKLFDDEHMENEARKALDTLQLDVETQARANRSLQEQLKQAIQHINGVMERVVGHPIHNCIDSQKTVDAVQVEKLCDEWVHNVGEWTDAMKDKKRRDSEKLLQLQEEMENRVREIEQSQSRERDDLQAKLSSMINETTALSDTIQILKSANVKEREKQNAMQQNYQLQLERLQMENDDWRMRLLQKTDNAIPSAEAQQRHALNLITQLKQSELRERQWEMLFERQTQTALQTEERVSMLLEDVNRSGPVVSTPSTYMIVSDQHASHTDRRTSLVGSTTSSELHFYQQRIEFLEEQLREVKEQIHCDHHEFLYEQQKWDLAKKHMGHDVEEVHNVSLKVLKLLLIREKLLKKQETKMQQRRDKVKNDELSLRARQEAIHACLETALQECGVALLCVRQLALASTTQNPSTTLPVKPIKLVRVLKRLKAFQQDHALGGNSSAERHHSPTTSSTRTSDAARSKQRVPSSRRDQ